MTSNSTDGWGCDNNGWDASANSVAKPCQEFTGNSGPRQFSRNFNGRPGFNRQPVPEMKNFPPPKKMTSNSTDGWGCGNNGWDASANAVAKPCREFAGNSGPRHELTGNSGPREFSRSFTGRPGFNRQPPLMNKLPPIPPSTILFVDGIENKNKKLPLLSVEEITKIFWDIANISVLDVTRPKQHMRINHSATVEVGSVADAHKAIDKLNGLTLDSQHTLTVTFCLNGNSRVPKNEQILKFRKFKYGRDQELNRGDEEEHDQEGGEEKAEDSGAKNNSSGNDEAEEFSSCSSGDLPVTRKFSRDEIVDESADESTKPGTEGNDEGGGEKAEDDGSNDAASISDSDGEFSSCSSGDLTGHGSGDEIVDESVADSYEDDGKRDLSEDEMPVF
ncbi:hypothetical protein niasHT_030889 [Heterodera trifolii]|uniref:RRM domain-containing protein n=1 Tax=Heterodera trifolii TaxID=157864 RepID=A0ABD2I631_9BILA